MNDKTTEPPRVERQIEALAKALLPEGWPERERVDLTTEWKPLRNEVVATVVATVPSLGASPEVTWTIQEHATGSDATAALLALRDDLAAHMRARRDELTATLAECGVGKE